MHSAPDLLPTLGNRNTLCYDYQAARRERWLPTPAGRSREEPLVGVPQTRLLHEQQWSALAVQLFEEPAYVAPMLLTPPGQIRLIVQLSGAMRLGLSCAGRQLTYDATPGTVKLTTPGPQPYEMWWSPLGTTPVRTTHCYLPEQLLAQVAEAAGLNPARVELAEGSGIADLQLCQLGQQLAQEVATPAALDSLYGDTATQLLAARLLAQHCVFPHQLPGQRGQLTAAQLRHLREYVQAHLPEAIRLNELAALVHLSAYHFCRVFKRTTGLSPNQFVIQQRLEKAVALLRYSNLRVGEVAAAVGYNSPTHLAQLLVRHTGRLPTAYLVAGQDRLEE